MKRFLSLMIALILVLSLFAVNVVAFADDAENLPDTEVGDTETGDNETEDKEDVVPHAPVGFDAELFRTEVYNKYSFHIEMSKTFMLDLDWLDDAELVNKIFPGINYVIEDADEDEDEPAETAEEDEDTETPDESEETVVPNDVIYVLYCNPSSDPRDDMKDWSRCAVTSTFSVTTEGLWIFRFAVVDGAKASEKSYSFDYDDVLATTYDNVLNAEGEVTRSDILDIYCYTVDTTSPVVDLSTTMQNKQNDGLKVGTTYSISTSLDIEDCSSTTVTYLVYKKVGTKVEGADSEGWLQIYDSKNREVTEGYENNISTSGVITPLEEDVTGEYVYKIVYTVVDSWLNPGVNDDGEEHHPVLMLKVSEADETEPKAIEAWKIVLYVIAGLAAVGIVILLCIKPKQETADTRYSATETDENNEDTDTTK